MSLDDRIGELYALPLAQFVTARTALAKTLTGDAAKQVKSLTKPTVLPWAVNQVYWHSRPLYDRVLKAGTALRRAQIASLEGRPSDVRDLTAAHRAAIGAAVKEAAAIAARDNASPAADALARLFEAVSLHESLDQPHGRLTEAVVPAGFEALLGVAVKAPVRAPAPATMPASAAAKPAGGDTKRQAAALAVIEKQRAEDERRRQQAIGRAEKAVAAAKADEQEARRQWEAAEEKLAAARKALEDLRERPA